MLRLQLGLVLALGLSGTAPAAFATTAFAEDPLLAADPPTSGEPEPAADAGEIAPADPLESLEAAQPPDAVPKRLFGIIPNYRANPGVQEYKPLTTAEKFHIAAKDTFDWPNFFLLGGFAIQAQVASGGFTHNGGLTGFGEFYGRALGDALMSNYVTEAILPTLLHEDPRFFRLGHGSGWYRAFYAASRIFVTRTDKGTNRFNTSEVVGNAGVVAVASMYYPDSQSASAEAERYGIQLGNDMISNLLTEFWPDIKRHMPFRHH